MSAADSIGIEDRDGFTAQTEVEAALAEIYQHILTANAVVWVSLDSLRETDANGAVGAIAANGGILASDTTPAMIASSKSAQVSWAASNSDPVRFQLPLPDSFDGTGNVLLDLWLASGSTDAANMGVQTMWDGGAAVSDAADDSATKSASVHKVTVTIDAADVPDSASYVTVMLTPPAHTTNAIVLAAIRMRFKRKLLTA